MATRKATAKKAAKKTAAGKRTAKKATKKTAAPKKTVKKAAKKTAAKKTVRKTVTKRPAAKKTAAKKATPKKTTARKAPAKKATTKKTAAKKTSARKALANTRKLLRQKQEQARQVPPWQALDGRHGSAPQPGFQSDEARVQAEALHEAETRMAGKQGSISAHDRHDQGRRDSR